MARHGGSWLVPELPCSLSCGCRCWLLERPSPPLDGRAARSIRLGVVAAMEPNARPGARPPGLRPPARQFRDPAGAVEPAGRPRRGGDAPAARPRARRMGGADHRQPTPTARRPGQAFETWLDRSRSWPAATRSRRHPGDGAPRHDRRRRRAPHPLPGPAPERGAPGLAARRRPLRGDRRAAAAARRPSSSKCSTTARPRGRPAARRPHRRRSTASRSRTRPPRARSAYPGPLGSAVELLVERQGAPSSLQLLGRARRDQAAVRALGRAPADRRTQVRLPPDPRLPRSRASTTASGRRSRTSTGAASTAWSSICGATAAVGSTSA